MEVYDGVGLGPGAVVPGIPEGQCSAHSEYSGIEEGVQVEVLDADGSITALGELGPGQVEDSGTRL